MWVEFCLGRLKLDPAIFTSKGNKFGHSPISSMICETIGNGELGERMGEKIGANTVGEREA